MNDSTAARKLAHEKTLIAAMIAHACAKQKHGGASPCADCGELTRIAQARLENCRGRRACGVCAHPCYPPALRERMRAVMRLAGPAMLLKHPLLTLEHGVDTLKAARTQKREAAKETR